MAHFCDLNVDGLKSLNAHSEGSGTSGSVRLWFPYIEMNSDRRLSDTILRLPSAGFSQEDQEMFYVFFHEYIHIVQSALFPVCQYPLTLTHQYIYDMYTTAKCRQQMGARELLPLIHNRSYLEELDLVRRIYGHSTPVPESSQKTLTLVNVIEGVARIIEEKYRGQPMPYDEMYSMIEDANMMMLGDKALSRSELLDVAEVALLTQSPDVAFVELLRISQNVGTRGTNEFYQSICEIADENGFKLLGRSPQVVINSTQAVLKGVLFEHYNRYVEDLYRGLSNEYGQGPVFSSIYNALSHDSSKGLPLILIGLIAKYGTPAICYPDGYMEQLDRRKDEATVVSQDMVGVKAVVESVSNPRFAGCGLFNSCNNAYVANPADQHAPSWSCVVAPWQTETFSDGYCPFQAIWRQFGLGELERGRHTDSEKEFHESEHSATLEFRMNTSFSCVVRVWSNDKGGVPHFHVYTEDENERQKKTGIDCAIRINEARYFKHNIHIDELNSSQRKELNNLLRKPKSYKGEIVIPWQVICKEWNSHCPVMPANEGEPMPDYSSIEDG